MDVAERERLVEFLKIRLHPDAEIKQSDVAGPGGQDEDEFWIGAERRGWVRKDDEDPDDISYSVGFSFKTDAAINAAEDRLREVLNPAISLRERKSLGRTQIDDSVELYVGPEFMGLLYKENAKGGFTEYTVEIQILSDDLEDEI